MASNHRDSSRPTPVGELKRVGRIDTGVVFEQAVEVLDKAGHTRLLRQVELHLDERAADGHNVMQVLTTVPAEHLDAREVARMFLQPGLMESPAYGT